jgi:hypothetical protein
MCLARRSATSRFYYDWVIKTRNAHPDVPMVVAEFLYEAGPDRGCAGSCCGGCHQGCGPDTHNHGYQCPVRATMPPFAGPTIHFIDTQILRCMHSARQANNTDSAAKRMIMWDIYMAGGFGTWYNCDTAWCVIIDSAET